MKKIYLSVAFLATVLTANAGGYLTNTNQSVAFLRNPAQGAVIGIGGVYANPAGVSFMKPGFHLGVNWQAAFQTREVTSTFAPFAYGVGNNGAEKYFEGRAAAPVIPSLHAAYVRNRWNVQFGFGVVGGGGKAEFEQGLGSFERQVALLGMLGANQKLGFDKYAVDAFMRGKQYYFGFTAATGYKINDHLSASVGLRGVYANANYYGYLRNLQINAGPGQAMVSAPAYFSAASQDLAGKAAQAAAAAQQYQTAAEQAAAAGNTAAAQQAAAAAQQYKQGAEQAAAGARTMGVLAAATQDVTLNADQTAFGIAPIVGLHYHHDCFDVAVKYEFATRLSFKNQSANSASADNLAALAAFKDGATVRGDIPAMLTIGAQYRPISSLRLNAGYHYYFDKQAKHGTAATGWKNELLNGGTQEVLFGAEYDLSDKFEISAGYQRTIYPNTDAYMNDLSFTTSSSSVGLGIGYRLNDRIKLNVGYLQTFYDNYDKATNNYNNTANIVKVAQGETAANALIAAGALQGKDSFTRSSKVLGMGVELSF